MSTEGHSRRSNGPGDRRARLISPLSPPGWKRALTGHQAENVTQEYGWQESERILEDAEVKL